MDADTAKTIASYLALVVPITVAIAKVAKLAIEWMNQRHSLTTARIKQAHEITTHYLDRALDPKTPLAIRQQLLRFLATPDKDGSRLNAWAGAELRRVESIVENSDRAIAEAEKELLAATSKSEVTTAERKLAMASRKKQSLLEPAAQPPISPEALRAEMIVEKNLEGLVMVESNLNEMRLLYRNLQSSNFSGSQIQKGNFQGSDLRAAKFEKTDLTKCSFYDCDLRAADLRGAKLAEANLQGARLEDADLSGADLTKAKTLATYNSATKWPEGFHPEENGAIKLPE